MDWKNPQTWAVVVLLGAALIFGRLLVMDSGSNASSAPAEDGQAAFSLLPASSQKTVSDWTLHSVDGSSVKLSQAVRKGPVVIDLWALYCGPCRMELPDLDAIYKKYGSSGAQFYALNVADAPPSIKSYVRQAKLSVPMLYDPGQKINYDLNVNLLPNVNSIPITLVIDKNMRLVTYCVGYDSGMGKDLPKALDQLTGTKI